MSIKKFVFADMYRAVNNINEVFRLEDISILAAAIVDGFSIYSEDTTVSLDEFYTYLENEATYYGESDELFATVLGCDIKWQLAANNFVCGEPVGDMEEVIERYMDLINSVFNDLSFIYDEIIAFTNKKGEIVDVTIHYGLRSRIIVTVDLPEYFLIEEPLRRVNHR